MYFRDAAIKLALAPLFVQTAFTATTPGYGTINWVKCANNVPFGLNTTGVDLTNLPPQLHCGRVDVPLDYSKPFSSTNKITLGLAMYRPSKPKGTLFYNPGIADPAAIVAWQVALNQTNIFDGLLEYDLMMMDVRGTYSSNQLNVSLPTFNPLLKPYPTTQQEYDTFKAASARMFQSWINLSSPPGILAHVGTVEITQDFDVIRKALNYQKINFLGASYGSYRALQYANTFPDHVGNFVLDAITPHGLSDFTQAQDSVAALDRALLRADAYCLNDPQCPFNSQGKGAVPAAFKQVLAMARKAPLTAPSCVNTTVCYEKVTPNDVQFGMLNLLSGQPDFPLIFEIIGGALQGDADGFAGGPIPNVQYALNVPLACVDNRISDNTFASFDASYQAGLKSDTTGINKNLAWELQLWCSGWPFATPADVPLSSNKPLMLVTADFDVNTPAEWAFYTDKYTPNSALVVRHGDDHVTFDEVTQPATKLEKEFLRSGVLPAATDQTFVTVYPPGVAPGPVEDPYLVPTGAKAGDIDSGAPVKRRSAGLVGPEYMVRR